jgi:hypothetical protein
MYMKKKVLCIVLGLTLLFAGQAFAEEDVEVVNPDSELYDTTREMEDAEYDLTEDTGEKILLQDQYAGERLDETEIALENGDQETSEELLEDYNEHVQERDKNIEEAKAAGEDITEVETVVAENSKKRSENLSALLEREDLPEGAKAGITKALENQEKAMQKLESAQEKAEAARQKGEEKAQEGKEKAQEGKEKGNKAQEDAKQGKNENVNKGEEKAQPGKPDTQDKQGKPDQEVSDSNTQQESPEQEQEGQEENQEPTTEEGQGNAPEGKPSGTPGGRP